MQFPKVFWQNQSQEHHAFQHIWLMAKPLPQCSLKQFFLLEKQKTKLEKTNRQNTGSHNADMRSTDTSSKHQHSLSINNAHVEKTNRQNTGSHNADMRSTDTSNKHQHSLSINNAHVEKTNRQNTGSHNADLKNTNTGNIEGQKADMDNEHTRSRDIENTQYNRRQTQDISAKKTQNKKQIWIVLDQLHDPQNIGAIIRTCAALLVQGIIVDDRCTPMLSQALAKSASGGLEHIDIYRVANIAESIKFLKKNDVWCYALREGGEDELFAMQHVDKMALIFGQEGGGVRSYVQEVCDGTVALSTNKKFSTLNVSCAVAAALYGLQCF
jgi:tRNA G18 (ribose-2'-O)-methylase SpoU